jgi:hypothetical protein
MGKFANHLRDAKSNITRTQIMLFFANIAYLLIFAILFAGRKNYEFLIYIVTVAVFMLFIARLHLRYNFTTGMLLGLSGWGLMHMLGGFIIIDSRVLYAYQLVPVVLRYDQFVHAFGFGFSTLLGYYILRPSLCEKPRWVAVSILVVLIGMGIGAVNEIVEFIAVKTVPETNVGGYDNTMFDLVFNTIGAVLAVSYVNLKRKIIAGKGLVLG